MKILIVTNVRNKIGGILQFTEHLMVGFRKIGHEVDLVELKPSKGKNSEKIETIPEGFSRGIGSGVATHPTKGWRGLKSYSMLNKESVSEFVEYANGFDLVIQNTPFGYACQETEQDLTWLPCVSEIKTKQLMVLHDGNMKRNCPWLVKLQQYFTAIACVHESALVAADFFTIPRNLIFNPFDLSQLDHPRKKFSARSNVILSPQTFKPIKRVETLLRAIPYMKDVQEVFVAGEGIEFNYMTSVDKCKDAYRVSFSTDPQSAQEDQGKKIWDVAEASGKFKYLGPIHGEERDRYLSDVKFLIDSSWSLKYGEHYNRTIFECMIAGAVPIAVNYGVSDNEQGNGKLLKARKNYLMLKHDMRPADYATEVDSFCHFPDKIIDEIMKNNDELLKKHFDQKVVAQQYIDLANGLNSGFNPVNLLGVSDPKMMQKAQEAWNEQFDAPQAASLEGMFE